MDLEAAWEVVMHVCPASILTAKCTFRLYSDSGLRSSASAPVASASASASASTAAAAAAALTTFASGQGLSILQCVRLPHGSATQPATETTSALQALLKEWDSGVSFDSGRQLTRPVKDLEREEFEHPVHFAQSWRCGTPKAAVHRIKVFVGYAWAQVEAGKAENPAQALQQLWTAAQAQVSSLCKLV